MLYTKYESYGPSGFRQEDLWKLHFQNLFFDNMTYLCNQFEPKFGQNTVSSFRGEDILVKILIHKKGQ